VEKIADPKWPLAAVVSQWKAGGSRAMLTGFRGEKKDEDLFDKFLDFSVNTSRFYCWHCSSIGIKQAKLNL